MKTRRFFLGAASLLAFSIASKPALAGLHFHGTYGATGKSVLNAFGTTDFPWINLAKNYLSQSFATATPASLNADQYPVNGALPDTIGGIILTPPSFNGVAMMMKWLGTGSVSFGGNVTISAITNATGASVGNNPTGFTIAGTNGRVVFSFNAAPSVNGESFNFPSGATFTNMSGLVYCRTSDEATITGGGIFLPEFLAAIQSLNPRIIRMMGWALNAGSDILLSQYAYRRTVNAISYYNSTWVPNAWVGTVAGSGAGAYTCSPSVDMPGTAWVDGMMFQGHFTNANTGAGPWTIQPTGFAAKTIVGIDSTAIAAGNISSGQNATFVYNSTLDQVLFASAGIKGGPPIEIRVALCNALKKDIWNNFPYLYTDASALAEAAYVAANLNTSLNAYFEVSNEVWNFALSNATNIASNIGTALGVTSSGTRNLYAGFALRHRQMMGQVTAAFAGQSSRLFRSLMYQTVGPSDPNMNTYLFQGTDLSSFGYNSAPNRPIDYTDVLGYAPYYYGAQCKVSDAAYTAIGASGIADLITQADNYAGGGAGITTALTWLDGDIRQGTVAGTGAQGFATLKANAANVYPGWESLATTYSKSVVCYEGGLSCIAPTTAECTTLGISTAYSAKIANLIAGYKNSSFGSTIVISDNKQFLGTDPAAVGFSLLPHSKYPAWLSTAAEDQWSLFPGDLFSTPYQTYFGMQTFNNT